jgi:hypothetical protein
MITTISGISVLLLSLAWVLSINILPSGAASHGYICTPRWGIGSKLLPSAASGGR